MIIMPAWLKAIVVLGLVALSVWLGYDSFINKPDLNATITVEVSPADATITIDGRHVRAGDTKVVAGQHTVLASRAGFANQTQPVTAAAGQTAYVGFALVSSSPSTKNWYSSHGGDQKLAEAISSHRIDYYTKASLAKNSLLQQLPIVYDGAQGPIRLDAGLPLPGSSQPAVYVTAPTVADRLGVLAWLRDNGYDPALTDLVFYSGNYAFSPSGGQR